MNIGIKFSNRFTQFLIKKGKTKEDADRITYKVCRFIKYLIVIISIICFIAIVISASIILVANMIKLLISMDLIGIRTKDVWISFSSTILASVIAIMGVAITLIISDRNKKKEIELLSKPVFNLCWLNDSDKVDARFIFHLIEKHRDDGRHHLYKNTSKYYSITRYLKIENGSQIAFSNISIVCSCNRKISKCENIGMLVLNGALFIKLEFFFDTPTNGDILNVDVYFKDEIYRSLQYVLKIRIPFYLNVFFETSKTDIILPNNFQDIYKIDII